MMESKEEVISEKTFKETMPSVISSSKTVKTPQNNDFSNNSPKEIDYIQYSNLLRKFLQMLFLKLCKSVRWIYSMLYLFT